MKYLKSLSSNPRLRSRLLSVTPCHYNTRVPSTPIHLQSTNNRSATTFNHIYPFNPTSYTSRRELCTSSDVGAAAVPPKPKVRVQDILGAKAQREYGISRRATVADAVSFLTEKNLSSAVVLADDGSIEGIFTARDLLRFMHNFIDNSGNNSSSTGSCGAHGKALQQPITQVMTKKEKLVYCSPTDSVKRCRETMFLLKVRNLPVINQGEFLGIVTMKDLADSSFSLSDSGGKKGFIHSVTGRKGIPEGTKPSADSSAGLSRKPQINVNIGSYALPHPFKSEEGVASGRRDYGAKELCNDMSLCEDAHFTLRVGGITPGSPSQVYLCVADGVGSWRQYNVDPRLFSHSLVKNAERVVLADAQQRSILHENGWIGGGMSVVGDQDPIHPLDVMVDAWNLTISERVNGSCTMCVTTIDQKLNQLSYSNVGDGGLMVVRHIDSETAGYMRERQQPRHLRNNDLKIAFLAQQQLRSFNLPYQLGFSGDAPGFKGNFETPNDSDTSSIALLPGDVVILATDGLFDNIDLHEIVDEVSSWEKEWFPSIDGSEIQKNNINGEKATQSLAERLVNKAREYSLDKNRDSPFALLAKENDIMWGGGMPDDTTVIVARIFTST